MTSTPRALPLMRSQLGMRDGHLTEPLNPAFNVGFVSWFGLIDGHTPDPRLLVEAGRRALSETTTLTVRLRVEDDGTWRQLIDTSVEPVVGLVDLRSHDDPAAEFDARMMRHAREPFDLIHDALCRTEVVVVADDAIAFCGWAHHMVIDGFGSALFRARLLHQFVALVRDEPAPPSFFADYADVVGSERVATDDEDEAVLGIPLHNRATAAERVTPSMLMTELPLRIPVPADVTMGDLAEAVRAELALIRPHSLVRPEALRQALPSAWRSGRVHGPTVNVFSRPPESTHDGVTTTSTILDFGPVQDISIVITDTGGSHLDMRVSTNPSLYPPGEATRHADRLGGWIERCLALPPTQPVATIPPLTDAERSAHDALVATDERFPVRSGHGADDVPVRWGDTVTVAQMLELGGAPTASRIGIVNRRGLPVTFGEVGEVTVGEVTAGGVVNGGVTAGGVVNGGVSGRLGVLAALTPEGIVYRGPASERVRVRGRWVERGANATEAYGRSV